MRISDWSSDVCSSDLNEAIFFARQTGCAISLIASQFGISKTRVSQIVQAEEQRNIHHPWSGHLPRRALSGVILGLCDVLQCEPDTLQMADLPRLTAAHLSPRPLGSASCRERVCQYV